MYAWWFNRYASMGGSILMKTQSNDQYPGSNTGIGNWVASLHILLGILTYGFDELQAAFISGRCAMEIN